MGSVSLQALAALILHHKLRIAASVLSSCSCRLFPLSTTTFADICKSTNPPILLSNLLEPSRPFENPVSACLGIIAQPDSSARAPRPQSVQSQSARPPDPATVAESPAKAIYLLSDYSVDPTVRSVHAIESSTRHPSILLEALSS